MVASLVQVLKRGVADCPGRTGAGRASPRARPRAPRPRFRLLRASPSRDEDRDGSGSRRAMRRRVSLDFLDVLRVPQPHGLRREDRCDVAPMRGNPASALRCLLPHRPARVGGSGEVRMDHDWLRVECRYLPRVGMRIGSRGSPRLPHRRVSRRGPAPRRSLPTMSGLAAGHFLSASSPDAARPHR